MKSPTFRQETPSIVLSIAFLAFGLLTVWVSKTVLKLDSNAVFVSLLLLPIVVYVIVSGRLGELKAPGGLEAKFVTASGATVEGVAETIEPSEDDMVVIEKAGASALQSRLTNLDESRPIVLKLTLGREGNYDRRIWRDYMEALSQYRAFKFVLFLNSDGKFVAYAPSWVILQILRMELGHELVEIINTGAIDRLRLYPGIVTQTISTTASNIEALKEMTIRNVEALVVIDDQRKVRGIVERDQIISKLMLAMAR
jgi:CBS domain-containing protein